MNVLIVGASAGLGRALAEVFGLRGHDLLLTGGDATDLAAVASNVRWRYGVRAEPVEARLGVVGDEDRLLSAASAFGPLDAVLLPVGMARDDDSGLLEGPHIDRIVAVNFSGQVRLLSRLWTGLTERPRAYVVGFGSVAAVRGRRRNMVYAASKRGLSSYFESLRHLSVGTRVNVQFYQLGYLRTQQTFGKKLPFPAAEPEAVAAHVIDNLDRDRAALSLPRFWGAIGLVLGRLPWFVYKRLDF